MKLKLYTYNIAMVKYLGIKFVFKYKYYIFYFNGRKRSRLVYPYLH